MRIYLTFIDIFAKMVNFFYLISEFLKVRNHKIFGESFLDYTDGVLYAVHKLCLVEVVALGLSHLLEHQPESGIVL